MSDFLLELRCEEIPARMQAGARADLEKLFRKEMDAAGVAVGELTVWSTPRRLALIARGLPAATAAVSEEVKGPRVGAPPQALEGFLRKTGLSEDQLVERDGVLFAITEKPGRATADVLAEAIPAIVRAFPWPKSQRWGAASLASESLRWVRPLSAIVALLDGQVVECEVGGIRAGRLTRGHRFHSEGEISVDGVDDYAAKLRAANVIVDQTERQDLVRAGAAKAAADAGLTLVEDEGLVIENAGLTEWPVPLLGRFDAAYLDVPPEVIQLTARTNQKYFVCNDSAGKLANAFVCTANIVASDGGAGIVDGNRKVLAARLSDARFFWEQDRKTKLEHQAKKLGRITFHEKKLGTVTDKVERVAMLAEWLADEGIVPNCDLTLARQAADLCKADLVTDMVGEFPELQGLMGGYYARAEGLPEAVADAIRDHYKPVGQGDDVPTAPVTVAVSLADKLDTLVSFLMVDEYPTGSRDPFALRRATFSILSLILEAKIRFNVYLLVQHVMKNVVRERIETKCKGDERFAAYVAKFWPDCPNATSSIGEIVAVASSGEFADDARFLQEEFLAYVSPWYYIVREGDIFRNAEKIVEFILDRVRSQSRALGVRPDVIESVIAFVGQFDLYSSIVRARALNSLVESDDGQNLVAGYKRAANILRKEGIDGIGEIELSYTPEPAEKELIDALDSAGPKAASAVAAEDFGGAMAALASLRGPIDMFFDQVTVNDADPAKRAYRLSLLARLRDAVHGVADFSRIEG